MYFANPSVLWALFALAIPIIIHLFNFRRFKKVYFSNVALLREIKIDTQSTNRLKHLLILACRILAILFLILAFAQPFITSNNKNIKQGSSAISIFVDNSFSMNAENKSGNLLENAKKAGREIAMAYKPSDKFQLLTNDFEGRHQRLFSRDEFLEMLDNVQTTAATKNFEQINSRQADVLSTANQNIKKAYIVSDFQQSMYALKDIKVDTTFTSVFVPFTANETTNIYIDSVWFETPNHQLEKAEILNVKLKATGTEGQTFDNIPVKLYINNEQKALASFSIETPSTTTLQLNFTNKNVGLQQCRIELQDHPITFDDNFYFAFKVNENVKVNSINGGTENQYLNYLFTNDGFCKYSNSNAGNIDYSTLNASDFLIVNEVKNISTGLAQELTKYIKNGGTVLIIPSNTIDVESYNSFLQSNATAGFTAWDTSKTKVERINLQHSLYNDIFEKDKLKKSNLDLPVIFGHYNSQPATNQKSESLLQLQNGANFLYSSNVGKGRLFVTTSPLNTDYSNFVKHALFVPSIYKMAITSIHQNQLYCKIGNDEIVKTNTVSSATDGLFHVVNTAKKFDFIPATRMNDGEANLSLHGQIKESGNYEIKAEKDLVNIASFNYNNLESNLTFYTQEQLQTEIDNNDLQNISVLNNKGKSLTQLVKEDNTGKSLWKTCLWLTLFFILAEVLLLSPIVASLFKKRQIA